MIALLRGRVAAATLGEVVLDVNGVGYAVRIAPGTEAKTGSEVTLHTHLAVRADALTLYGFATTNARDLFETLLGVSGVGPRLALAALGTLGEEGLRRAVVAEDVTALTVIPGVGRKGAQRMVLELRERLGAVSESPNGSAAHPPSASPRGEAAQALVALGYAPPEAARALDELQASPEATAEELLRDALRLIGART